MSDRPSPPLRAVRVATKCPICGRPGVTDYRPFCSKRCADIDLGRWLKEGYRIETDEGPPDDGPDDDNRSTGQRR